MKIFLFSGFFFVFQNFFSQRITGKISSDSASLSRVLVVNIQSEEKVYSNSNGEFVLDANPGDELRFIKEGYERKVLLVRNNDQLVVNLVKLVTEIEEVVVQKKLSGNLATDAGLFNENKKKVILNNDLKVYFKLPSSASLMKPKPGEFVQPVGSGFTFGKIDNQWTETDFAEWIRENFTDAYFISLGIKPVDISRFIFYGLQSFDKIRILKYGYCTDQDVGNLKTLFEKILPMFQK